MSRVVRGLWCVIIFLLIQSYALAQNIVQFDRVADKINYATAAFLVGGDSATILGDDYHFSRFFVKLYNYFHTEKINRAVDYDYETDVNINCRIAHSLSLASLEKFSKVREGLFGEEVGNLIVHAGNLVDQNTSRSLAEQKLLRRKLLEVARSEFQQLGLSYELKIPPLPEEELIPKEEETDLKEEETEAETPVVEQGTERKATHNEELIRGYKRLTYIAIALSLISLSLTALVLAQMSQLRKSQKNGL